MSAQELTLTIQRENGEGVGIAFAKDKAIFVPGVLTDEIVRARVLLKNKKTAHAVLTAMVHSCSDRVDPFCPYYDVCGGCSMQHMRYARALYQKAERVRDCLRRIGNFADGTYEFLPPIGMEAPFRYRNKAVAAIEGRTVGFYRAGSHDIIPIKDCLLQNENFANALAVTQKIPYDACSMLYRTASDDGVLVALNVRGAELPGATTWAQDLRAAIPQLRGALLGVHAGRERIGNSFQTLWGAGSLTDNWLGIHGNVSPQSFRQVNPMQAERLYNKALEFADLTGGEHVIDAYCGAGLLTQLLAARALDAVGIERVSSAIAEARDTARGIANLRFLQGDCEILLSDVLSCDVLILDPPRHGCSAHVLNAALTLAPDRIVYISCDPATLARDLRSLANGGYVLRAAVPIDMFPWTAHVECVTLVTH